MNAEHYRQTFLAHRNALTRFYAELPDQHANFAAWDGGMSFLKQADHLALTSQGLLAMLKNETPQRPEPAATLTEVRERLQSSSDSVITAIGSLTEADLGRTVTAFGGRQMPVAVLLDMLIGHEAHHKGQVWQMARMVGLNPGLYVQRD